MTVNKIYRTVVRLVPYKGLKRLTIAVPSVPGSAVYADRDAHWRTLGAVKYNRRVI